LNGLYPSSEFKPPHFSTLYKTATAPRIIPSTPPAYALFNAPPAVEILEELEPPPVPVELEPAPVVIVALLVMLPVPLVVVPVSGTLVVTATTVLVLVLTNVVEAVEAVVVALRPLE